MLPTLEFSKIQLTSFSAKSSKWRLSRLSRNLTKLKMKNCLTSIFLLNFVSTLSNTLKICISRRVKSMKTFFKIFSMIVLTFRKNSVSRNLNLKIWKNKCSLKKCSKRRKIDRPWNRWRKRTKRKVFKFKLTITWKTKVISQS